MIKFRIFFLGLVCALPLVAAAQWQWIDKDGRKVFSDRSPPSDVPAKNILRQPGGKGAGSVAVSTPAADPAAAATAAASAPRGAASGTLRITGKDKALEDKKKEAEAAEAEKLKADAEKQARAKADNCARARQAKSALDSGQRIAVVNARGEREVMEDGARAAEAQRLQGIIAADCAS